MKRIVIERAKTECSDAIGYIGEGSEFYTWKAFCNQIIDASWLGFSVREVIPQVINDSIAIIDCKEELVEDFLTTLCEASSIDFSYSTVK